MFSQTMNMIIPIPEVLMSNRRNGSSNKKNTNKKKHEEIQIRRAFVIFLVALFCFFSCLDLSYTTLSGVGTIGSGAVTPPHLLGGQAEVLMRAKMSLKKDTKKSRLGGLL